MTTAEDFYEAVRDGVAKALGDAPLPRRMMPIAAFPATDEEGRTLRVVGISEYDGEALQFVCVRDDPDNEEIWPLMLPSVWRAE